MLDIPWLLLDPELCEDAAVRPRLDLLAGVARHQRAASLVANDEVLRALLEGASELR
jgi:hypothetical protein